MGACSQGSCAVRVECVGHGPPRPSLNLTASCGGAPYRTVLCVGSGRPLWCVTTPPRRRGQVRSLTATVVRASAGLPMTRLVVPTDFSTSAAEAFAYALGLACATDAEVHLVHVLSGPDAPPVGEPGSAPTAVLAHREAERVRAALDAVGREAAAGVSVSTVVRQGRAVAPEVAALVQEVDADLLVAGACGARPRRHGPGAVAAEIVDTAPCDVLLVPHRANAPFSQSLPRRLLVPIDFSGASRPLAVLAFGLARDVGAEAVDLVHVLESLPHPVRWIDETLIEAVPEIRERAGEALRDLAVEAQVATTTATAGLAVSVYVERGKPARTLARVAEALASDLVVVGPHAERPVFDRLLGSVAEGVVRRVRCPVLVARRSAAVEAEDLVDRHSFEADPV